MSFTKIVLISLSLTLFGCGEIFNDLFPTGSDERTSVDANEVGPLVGQRAPDFSTRTSLNDTVKLSTEVSQPGTKAVVLYFAMWCPVCNSHMDHLLRNIVPFSPGIRFFAIDYLSGSVQDVRSNVIANGYVSAPISVLADLDKSILNAYKGTMGTTIVINSAGTILMNEDYKNGTKLSQILGGLP